MNIQTSFPELCPSCIHMSTCTRPEQFDLPIVYCERYLSDSPSHPFAHSIQELQGLCRTCSNRYTCVLFKPEGGVWHCNDYQ